jgi:hypothetical protein
MRETRIGRASVLKWMDLGGLLYVQFGRPSVPPELLLRALLESLYSIRSDRQLMEQLDYNLFISVVCLAGASTTAYVRRGILPI